MTETELRVGVLHRLYGDELPAARLTRIAARMALMDAAAERDEARLSKSPAPIE
jgi:hypothetical protein